MRLARRACARVARVRWRRHRATVIPGRQAGFRIWTIRASGRYPLAAVDEPAGGSCAPGSRSQPNGDAQAEVCMSACWCLPSSGAHGAGQTRPAARLTPPGVLRAVSRPWALWNTPDCETTSRWTALAGRLSARPAGRGDRLNSTRESAICTSGTPSCRPPPARRVSRGAERPARLRSTSRRRERRRGWPARGRGKLSSAPRRCAFVPPARMTGPHGCTKCSPMRTAATCGTTGTGGPCTASWPAKIGPPRTRYSAPSPVSLRRPGIVDLSQ
jgi:hypothetical protein